jgi:hypothetical protein
MPLPINPVTSDFFIVFSARGPTSEYCRAPRWYRFFLSQANPFGLKLLYFGTINE